MLYYVHPKSMANPDDSWRKGLPPSRLCPDCCRLSAAARNQGVDVYLERPPKGLAMYDVDWLFISIALTGFLELFADEIKQYFRIGRVCDSAGALVEDYASIVSPHPLLVRGGPRSRHRVCGTCGSFLYTPADDWYVVRSALGDQPIHESTSGGLIMSKDLRRRIPRGAFRGIAIEEMDVVDEPRDGLAVIPERCSEQGTA